MKEAALVFLFQSHRREVAVRGVIERVIGVVLRVPHDNDATIFNARKPVLHFAAHYERGTGFAIRTGQFVADGNHLALLPPDAADGVIVAVGNGHSAM